MAYLRRCARNTLVPVSAQPYRQVLPALELSIERMTSALPDDGA